MRTQQKAIQTVSTEGRPRLPSAEIEVNNVKDQQSSFFENASTASSSFFGSKNKKNNKPKKSVCFHEVVNIRTTLHVNNYTDEEYFACWYNDDDLEAFKKEIIKTVRMHQRNQILPENSLTFRGLENRTKKTFMAREKAKEAALVAVLDEQDRQRRKRQRADASSQQQRQNKEQQEHEDYSATAVAIRIKYVRATRQCRQLAQIVGTKDALAAGQDMSRFAASPKGLKTLIQLFQQQPEHRRA